MDQKHLLSSSEIDISWDIRERAPEIWRYLCSDYPNLEDELSQHKIPEFLPFLNNLHECNENGKIRTKGSRRAFYVKSTKGYVFAIKGTEIFSTHFQCEFDNLSKHRLSNRPWNVLENFVYREQKLPLAMTLAEALTETQMTIDLQQNSIANFDEIYRCPVPLFNFKIKQVPRENYINFVNTRLDDRAKSIIRNIISSDDIGINVYFYPYLPERVRFQRPSTSFERFLDRSDGYSKLVEKSIGSNCTPITALNNFIDNVSKMLVLGYLPFSFQDHGVGQCIAPQNVTLLGDITDMGSLSPIENIKSFGDFVQLYYSMLVVMTATAREILISPMSETIYEFDEPQPTSILISEYISAKLASKISHLAIVYGLSIHPMLQRLFSNSSEDQFLEKLSNIYA